MSQHVTFTVLGEPASKANSRKIVTFGGRPAIIKSAKARSYADAFRLQCAAQVKAMIEGDVKVEAVIYYSSRRPDLDESVILDCMQGIVYQNDRQVKIKHIYWSLDKNNPRSIIRVSSIEEVVLPTLV
jgi:Holliday junction resolvase RusA-like endonuclease